jgi:hypothetical protein
LLAHRLTYRHSLALTAVAATVAALSGCGSTHASSEHSSYVQLTGGTYDGVPWGLFAWEQHSKLCMEVLPGGADPDHPATTPSWRTGGGGACAFDARHSGTSYYASAPGPGRSNFSYGPLPTRATQIKTATSETLITRPLPAGKGLPAGRYWIHLMPAGWPSKAEGTALATPQPLDATGNKVPFRAF